MNLTVMLLMLWPRLDAPAVGQRELDLCRQLEQQAAVTCPARSGLDDLWRSQDRIPGRYVVGFVPGAGNATRAWVERCGGRVVRIDGTGAEFLVAEFASGAAGPELAASASAVPEIRYFEPDIRVRAARIPDDPYFLSYQWDKWVMYADEAWDLAGSGRVKVGIVDNGVDYTHPDLAANFAPGEPGYDFVNNDNDPKPDNPGISQAFHGTHVSGIAAAVIGNGTGIAGWAGAQLLAVRVLDDSGNGNTSDLASGIRWAADRGCRVVNMSLGSSSGPSPLVEACRYAADRDVILVSASGNEGAVSINYPAALAECIAVGSLSPRSRLSTFSNRGPEQELVAPGEDVASAVPGGIYALADGTSMASPQVAGMAALVLSLDPTMTASRVRAIIAAAAIDMGSAGRDQSFGFGLVNARRAMELAGALVRTAAAPSVSQSRTATVVSSLPDGVAVYDASGRRVVSGRLGSGAYFVRDRSGRLRRLVVSR
jgi:subtilisin family serine protease